MASTKGAYHIGALINFDLGIQCNLNRILSIETINNRDPTLRV